MVKFGNPDFPNVYRKVDSAAGVVLYAFSDEGSKKYDKGMDGGGVGHGKMGGITVVPLSETNLDTSADDDWQRV